MAVESEQIGRVTGIEGEFAWVRIEGGGCGRCHESGGCGGQHLTQMFCSTPRVYRLRNRVGAQPGDRVSIVLPAGLLGCYATLAYGLPLLGLLLGALLGEGVSGEAGALLGGVAGCACGFLPLGRRSALWAGKIEAEPHIGEIKSSGG